MRDQGKEWRNLIAFLSILETVKSSLADWNRGPTGSMNPTLVGWDLVYVNKAFVMGDKRDRSKASRVSGLVGHDAIVLRAQAVTVSFNKLDHHQPMLRRWFSGPERSGSTGASPQARQGKKRPGRRKQCPPSRSQPVSVGQGAYGLPAGFVICSITLSSEKLAAF